MRKFLNIHWWENKLKYLPLAQELYLYRDLSLDFPSSLNIEVTNLCNLKCVYCPRLSTNKGFGTINISLFRKIIDEIAQERKLTVLWLQKDGEPLMHPKIDELISYAKRKNAAHRIEIYTNAILLDKKIGKGIISSGLDAMVVSIDAVEPTLFKKHKGRDAYDLVVRNVKNFMKLKRHLGVSKPVVAVKMIDMKETHDQIGEFRRIWRGVADNVIIQAYHTWEGSVEDRSGGRMRRGERYPCNLVWLNPAVNWNGTVTACCVNYMDNELTMGDLRKQTLKEIWQSPHYQKLREAHLRGDFAEFPTCMDCDFWINLPSTRGHLVKMQRPASAGRQGGS